MTTTPTTAVNTAAIASMIEDGRHLVPGHMWGGVVGYYIHGYPPGGFLTAVLSNDLMEAFGRADAVNSGAMHEWCQFLYNYTPRGSYGSPENVSAWLAQFAEQPA